jgi:hypothetical protein
MQPTVIPLFMSLLKLESRQFLLPPHGNFAYYKKSLSPGVEDLRKVRAFKKTPPVTYSY